MNKILIPTNAALLIGFLIVVDSAAQSGPDWSKQEPDFTTPQISLVSLIATPEKFDGKYIRVKGIAYFDKRADLRAIFLTREDKRKANSSNAIFLDFNPTITNPERLNDKFVSVQGTFRAADKGRLGAFAGTLGGVDKIREVTSDIR